MHNHMLFSRDVPVLVKGTYNIIYTHKCTCLLLSLGTVSQVLELDMAQDLNRAGYMI